MMYQVVPFPVTLCDP